MAFIDDLLGEQPKAHFTLIDPEDQTPAEAGRRAKLCEDYGTDAVMIGGSTVSDRSKVFDTVKAVKENVSIPTILFPNSAEAVSENADYIFFMMLLNSRDYRYLVGEQLKGAPLVEKWGIKPISMGYIIVSTGSKETTVERMAKLDKIRGDDVEKAVNYAIFAERFLGMSCVYLEAGSGAEKAVSAEMIRAVRDAVSIPIIVGGGITCGRIAKEKTDAGADVIVNGTAVESNIEVIEDIIREIKG